MFIVTHVVAGAFLGQAFADSPVLAFSAGFVSHFVLDFIPHGDRHHVVDYWFGERKNKKSSYRLVFTDSILAIIMTVLILELIPHAGLALAAGIIGSVFPDFLVGLSDIFKKNRLLKAFTKFHFQVHNYLIHKIDVKPIPGALMQLILICVLLALL